MAAADLNCLCMHEICPFLLHAKKTEEKGRKEFYIMKAQIWDPQKRPMHQIIRLDDPWHLVLADENKTENPDDPSEFKTAPAFDVTKACEVHIPVYASQKISKTRLRNLKETIVLFRSFFIPAYCRNHHIELFFKELAGKADIYLNDILFARHDGYSPCCSLRIDEFLQYGKENRLMLCFDPEGFVKDGSLTCLADAADDGHQKEEDSVFEHESYSHAFRSSLPSGPLLIHGPRIQISHQDVLDAVELMADENEQKIFFRTDVSESCHLEVSLYDREGTLLDRTEKAEGFVSWKRAGKVQKNRYFPKAGMWKEENGLTVEMVLRKGSEICDIFRESF